MGIFGSGSDKEYHDDGSVTERYSDGTSATRNSDGSMREYTEHEKSFPVIGEKITVTYDGDDMKINVQEGWGDND